MQMHVCAMCIYFQTSSWNLDLKLAIMTVHQ